jgi:CheY-like chemotaxis protein
MDRATIVLLEDHLDSLEMYSLLLRHAGYDVQEAPTAADAVKLLRRGRPDALVMDIGLPDVDGVDFCRRLRHDSRLESLPIIGVTGWTVGEDGSRLKDAPFTELLQKPVLPETFLATIARWAPGAGVALA